MHAPVVVLAYDEPPGARGQDPVRETQEWRDRIHGLWYCASMNANKPAVALYERAENLLADAPLFHRALADPVLLTSLRAAAHELGYRLV